MLDAVLNHVNNGARIPVCGMVSQYNLVSQLTSIHMHAPPSGGVLLHACGNCAGWKDCLAQAYVLACIVQFQHVTIFFPEWVDTSLWFVLCMVFSYLCMVQEAHERHGTKNLIVVIGKEVKIEGFMVSSHYHKLAGYVKEVAGYIKEGRLKSQEHVSEGIENWAKAFIGMLRGENVGKALVKVGSL